MLALLFMAMGFIQVFNVLAVATADQGLTPGRDGLILSLNGLLILLVEMPISQLIKRLPPQRILAVGFAVMALGLSAFAFAQSFVGFLVAMTIFTFGEIIALPVGMACSSDLAPEQYRGRYLGVRGVTWGFAGLVASSGLWFYDAIGPL
ncbi:MAG: MFS family permease [Lentimonas sp.]